MTTVPILTAALLVTATIATAQAAPAPRLPASPSLVQPVCYECEEYREAIREAREEAREEAAEAAAEYAEEMEEYGYRPRRARRRARVAKPVMVQKPSALENVAKASDEETPTGASGAKKKDVAANAPGGCKQYFPATGITLSVPCE